MDLDIFIFPSPEASYKATLGKELFFIPRFPEEIEKVLGDEIKNKDKEDINKEKPNENSLNNVDQLNFYKDNINENKSDKNTILLIENNKNNVENFDKIENKDNINSKINFDKIQNKINDEKNDKKFEESNFNDIIDINKNRKLENYNNYSIEDKFNSADHLNKDEEVLDEYYPITDNSCTHIPCYFLKNSFPTPKYALFFHGNAEDVKLSYEILNHIRNALEVNVIAPEYPGYGIYHGRPSEEGLYEDTLIVYDYLTDTLKMDPNNIIVFGRSIGSSPAIFLASRKSIAGLILVSPLLSIKTVIKDLLGNFISFFVNDRFRNNQLIQSVKCPTLIIHGQSDALIKHYHSNELYNLSKSPCELILPEDMDHNEFDFYQDFSIPLKDFIKRNEIFLNTDTTFIDIPSKNFEIPKIFEDPIKPWNIITKILKTFSMN